MTNTASKGRTSRSPRASARQTVLKSIREIKRKISLVQAWWEVSASFYPPGGGHRPRQASEYPEAQLRYWASTVAEIDKMIVELEELREHCVREFEITKAEQS